MHLFGLTGGIASGKSTVAEHLRKRGVPMIDADVLARHAVAPGTEGLQKVVDVFGEQVLGESGGLDRKALASVVFGDAVALSRLTAILHPEIARRRDAMAASLAASGEPLAGYEAALIVETGAAETFRPLVVVACSPEAQVERMRARGDSDTQARARMAAQMSVAEKTALADFVIDTSGPLEETTQQTDAVLRALCARLAVDPRRYFDEGGTSSVSA